MSMNKCMFIGNLTRDVELKKVGTTQVGSFGLAVSRKFKKKDGSTEEEVNFFDIEVWDKQADTVAKFFKKGSPIIIQCAAKQETWTDKASGGNRSKIKFRLEEFWFPPKPPKSHGNNDDDATGGNDNADGTGDGDEPTPF